MPNYNVPLTFLEPSDDGSNLGNSWCIEASAMLSLRNLVRIDDDVKLPCRRVLKGVLEAGNQVVGLKKHVL